MLHWSGRNSMVTENTKPGEIPWSGECVTCGGRLNLRLVNMFDTRLGIKGYYNICCCESCGLEQTQPRLGQDELLALYQNHYNSIENGKNKLYLNLREKFMGSYLYSLWMVIDGDVSFHRLKGMGRLLDVGCNEGRSLSIFRKHGFDAEGLEPNEKAAASARLNGHAVYNELLDHFQPDKKYDVVTLANVLEHDLNPQGMLRNIGRIVSPGGRVLISCPNSESMFRYIFNKYWINWHIPFHISHFSAQTLTNMLDKEGFQEIKIKCQSPSLWITLSILVRLKAKHGKISRVLRSPVPVAILMLLLRLLFFPVLWIANRLGRGDCLVISAKKADV